MRKSIWILALACVVGLAGCLEYQENVTLNEDGSGNGTLRFAISKAYLEQARQMSVEMAKMTGQEAPEYEEPQMISSEEEIDAFLKKHESGAKITDYEVSETDEMRVWNISYTFTKLEELNHVMGSVVHDPDEADSVESEEPMADPPTVTFVKGADGNWLFTREFAGDEQADGGGADPFADDVGIDDIPDMSGMGDMSDLPDYTGEEDDEQDLSGLEGLEGMEGLEDMEGPMGDMIRSLKKDAEEEKPVMIFTVTFPGKVLESNAKTIDGNTATWSFMLQELSDAMPSMTAVVAD